MSTPQRIPARTMLAIDRATADVLRVQAKNILAEITVDRLACGILDRLIRAYTSAVTRKAR